MTHQIVVANLRIASLSVRLIRFVDSDEYIAPVIQIEPDSAEIRELTPSRARILGEALLRYADAAESGNA